MFSQASALEAALKRTVEGEVRFDAGSRALYATDGSNYRQVPIGLVLPKHVEDVVAAVAACRDHGAPVLSRGAGTSLAGQCCNVAVVLDFTKYMHRILELNASGKYARIQPGVVCDTLRNAAEQHQLTWGPDPSTHNRCSLGGMIGNNSCGTHSLMAGKTADNIEELKILLYDGTQLTVGPTTDAELDDIIGRGGRRGEIYASLRGIRDRYANLIRSKYPDIPRRVSGFNLDQLLPENGFNVARALVGTEGTCAVVLEAKARLIPSPQHRCLVGLGYADAFAAADHVPQILEFNPIGLEGVERAIIEGLQRKGAPDLELMPAGRGCLFVEFGADDAATAEHLARQLVARLQQSSDAPDARVYSAAEAKKVWKIRESGPRAVAAEPGMPPRFEGWDDAAVAPEKLGPYLRDLRKLLDSYNYQAAYYGHFGHGCIHMQISFDFLTREGIRRYAEFVDRAADLVLSYGGSLSGEHGDGQSRGALLPKMFGPDLMNAFREFKTIWDPDNKMNPRKGAVDPYLPTENLRLNDQYKPLALHTHFKFIDDGGSLAEASLRCVGIGACRKSDGGTMCPSYMATLDEEHSTRGRAHLLFEMLKGEVVRGGWNEEHVKRSLDLCLSCKACKTECPTNVDIATYRAEFLSHYYERRRRPVHAYAFGMIDRWSRLASVTPGLANALSTAPGFSHMLRSVLGLAPQRDLPQFAARTFKSWARARRVEEVGRNTKGAAPAGKPQVILWVDTFNNFFNPETSQAALEVLEDAGFQVAIPGRHLCCGRPLYDFGFLDQAEKYLQHILDELASPIDAGVPVVVLEPSCASVFRDELPNLLPGDPRADRFRKQVFLLSELLEHQAPSYHPAQLGGKVLLHGHCHHKSILKVKDEESLLRRMGAEVEMPDAGCCGMAGPFGLAKDKFEISQAVGERVLLPAVRQASAGTVIVADGFSCQAQILQGTGRKAIHLAQAMRLASRRT